PHPAAALASCSTPINPTCLRIFTHPSCKTTKLKAGGDWNAAIHVRNRLSGRARRIARDAGRAAPAMPSLLNGLALERAVLKQLHVGLDVRVAGVLFLRLFELLVGAGVVAAQHVGEALVIEDFRRSADDADGFGIGAVGEIETAQPVVGCREAHPGFAVARTRLDGLAEVPLGQAEIVAAKIFLAKAEFVVGIVAEQP